MVKTCIIGLAWGDEGKGTIVDFLSPSYEYAVRYNGGANAGHTVVINNKTYKLHLVPSGIFSTKSVMGSNMVVSPPLLVKEIQELRNNNIKISPENLLIDFRINVTTKYHIERDKKEEALSGNIGTTCKGIGPTYENLRRGFTLQQLVNNGYKEIVKENLINRFNDLNLTLNEIIGDLEPTREFLKPFLQDTRKIIRKSNSVLFESGQGYKIGIYTGDKPYITCSDPTPGGIADSFGYTEIPEKIGVAKAYSTRVGHGPFNTELKNEIGDWIRKSGNEYGTTTGRPRRCGWFNCELISEAIEYCSINELAITHLDTLSNIPELKIKTSNGKLTNMKTWKSFSPELKKKSDLPINAQLYLEKIEEELKTPITIISIGSERSQKISLR